MDQRVLDYDYDEESRGFEEPEKVPGESLGAGEKFSLALFGFGALMFILQSTGMPPGGTWTGFLLVVIPVFFGSVSYFYLSFAGTVPGIKHDGIYFRGITSRGALGWLVGVVFTGFYIALYWYPQYLAGGIDIVNPLALALSGSPADRWFFYSFVYTLAVFVFGARMFMKYRNNRYQIIRTVSVMVFQLGFAFLIPNVLKLFNQPEFYLSYFWPLKYDYLFPETFSYFVNHPGGLGIFLIFWGAVLSFVATPILTYYFGKRWYCSWVCGCGGLAETLGDGWRQLSDKSVKAWRIERWLVHSVLVFVVVTTVFLWVNSATSGAVFGEASLSLKKWYGFYIGAVFSGVIGVGFYPLMGSRVWCRFGCPMAAVLGIFQRYLSRFRITANGDQCMSCGNCSTYCEMGIDVRAYAQKGENIVRASCVGCGVCSAVCPRGVLKLENGGTFKDRFEGSENPLGAFLDSLKRL